MKHILTDWEINGYDDSDFMASYYDDVTNTIGFTCYGSTRYVSATVIWATNGVTTVSVDGESLMLPNAQVVEKARLVLEELIFQKLKAADKRLVDTPDVADLKIGMRVRMLEKARMQMRESSSCVKCSGTGKWVNPRNDADKRDCFACKGAGKIVGEKLKDAKGKQVWLQLEAGLTGEALDWGSFGKFYASGYNQPCRENTSVQFRIDSGETVRASLSKLRLDQDYQSDETLRSKAVSLSFNYQFSALYPKFAWDTQNFAAQVAK
jgi:hypothetical protein